MATEHFTPDRKDTEADGYDNWYAVHQAVNQLKRRKEAQYGTAAFHAAGFFQVPGALVGRVTFDPAEGVFRAIHPADQLVEDLLDYLCVNDSEVYEARRLHLDELVDLFTQTGWDPERQREGLLGQPARLSFPSATAARFGVDVDALIAGRLGDAEGAGGTAEEEA